MDTQVTLDQVKSWSLFVERETERFPELLEASLWSDAYQDNQLVEKLYNDLTACDDVDTLNQKLRYHRRAEMVRIAIRDLKGLAPTQETLRDLSLLADGLISGALDWHYQQLCQRFGTPIGAQSGEPQKMLILGMGKLGGYELNFSSDIDLIFAYPEKGYATNERGRETSNDQFFIKLGQALNKSLTEFSAFGTVYRVDMRLRPFGDSGPLAVSFAELENYYEIHGRAWERYALVKARIIAGDKSKGEELFEILRPFVYRKYVDFTAIESLRELKMMINAEVQKKDKQNNIKLGRGGIREIEFITQAFQLVHGGRDTDLQGRELMPMLNTLAEKRFISPENRDKLQQAYLFLRDAENRLQEWNDQQTHDLPSETNQQELMAASLGFASYEAFLADLEVHLTYVQGEFDSLFAEASSEAMENDDLQQVFLADDIDVETLQSLQLEEADQVVEQLNRFMSQRAYTHASSESLTRFKAVLPVILTELKKVDNQATTIERVLKVIESVMARSVYLVLLKENLQAIDHLLELCSLSSWMTEMLVKYPALLDQLIDERVLYEPLKADELKKEVFDILDRTNGDDEDFMNLIRQWRHTQVFRVAAADVTGNLPVMKVSDYLTWIAEATLQAVVEFAWRFMQKRSGLPGGLNPNDPCPFMVLGYGKMGGIELGYGSDLDIVFLYHGLKSSACTSGAKPLENSVYFIRMGQKIISLMTTMMPTGTLYEVDTRLRPNGASGLMVTDFESFMNYQRNKAWTWEHQALVRSRAVVASPQGEQDFNAFKAELVGAQRELTDLRNEVVEMRNKMRQSLDKTNELQFDLKQGAGGIVDIEFMVQYFVLGYAHQHQALTEWSDNIRLLEAIKEAGILPESEVQCMEDAYRSYRKRYHRLSLQNQKAIVSSDEFNAEKQEVIRIWQKVMLD